MLKRYLCKLIIICISAIMVFIIPVHATEEEEKIKVGYFSSFTDFVYDLDNGNMPGYGYEIFEKIEEISGLSFEYIAIDGSLTDALVDGVVDVAGFAIRTDERQAEVLFSNTPYGKTYVALMTADNDITYNTPDSIDKKTVATYSGNYAQQYLDIYCERNNISVKYIYGDVHNYMNLDADFYITYAEDRNSELHNNVLNLGVFNLYLMSSHEAEDDLAKIDAAFSQIINSEGNYFLELEERYLSENLEINHRSLTQKEIDILQQRPLEVGYIDDYQPISYTNEQGEPDGAMVEMLSVLSERYDFEVNYHPYNLSDDPSEYENYDMLITLYGDGDNNFQFYNTTERIISIPMYAQVQYEIHRSNDTIDDMLSSSSRIGCLPYQFIDYDTILKADSDSEFVFYNDWHELLDAFAKKEIDIVLHTESASAYAERYLDGTDRVTVHTDIQNPMRLFISKDISNQYMPIINVMLDQMSESDYQAIIVTNSNQYYPEQGIFDFFKDNWYYFAILVFLVLGGFSTYAYKKEREKQKALTIAYNTDALTEMTAFHKFREMVDETLKKASPKEYELISLDVDMFKTINTHYSNERGTEVILAVSNGLKKAFEGTSAIITRRTADQFLILRKIGEGGMLKDIYNNEILTNVRDVVGEKYNISMSFGSSYIDNCQEKATAIIGQADNARVYGKHSHKTTFKVFDAQMQKHYEDRINITFRMEQALKDKEFFVEYQPKIDFKTLTIGGAEALVRWKPKLGDTIYPDDFIPVFEENGFISSLDLFVFEEVCKFIKENGVRYAVPVVSVNLSAHTILSGNVITRITDIIRRYDVSPNKIEFEITESAIESDTGTFLTRIKHFKQLGYSISIDDFGAGVSSLNRLSAIEGDVLKLDKAFFDLKDQGGKSTVVVADVVNMAKHLNMKVVAEGVETSAQALWLKGINCDYAQGYYFEKSMSEDSFIQLLDTKKVYTISLL